MKNLQKMSRENLKEILGGIKHDCNVDSDCTTVPGCGICTLFMGKRTCIMFWYDETTGTCPQ